MAREHNVIQQQDRHRNLQPARYLPCRYIQPDSDLPTTNQPPVQKKPATSQAGPSNLPNRTLQPANRTINLNHNL